MKRILAAGLLCAMISIFSTGCGSLMADMDPKYEEVESHAREEVPTESDGVQLTYGEEATAEEPPDYYDINIENKFQNLEGKQAFRIASGHSSASEDLESFQIGGLKENGTFFYAYVTRPTGGSGVKPMVHCVASYNYRSGQFKILHETRFMRYDKDKESFYIQVCEGDGDDGLFVYDNGMGYLYDYDGHLSFQTNIESFVRSCFDKAYSVVITQALTDGNRRIYLELAVEKEKINLPETAENWEDASEATREEGSEEEAEEEAERLNAEIEEKLQTVVLVYDFKELDTTINQTNTVFDEQNRRWRNMTQGKEYETEPDAEGDLRQVRNQLPDKFGPCYLPGVNNAIVYNWNSGRAYEYTEDGYICTFRPKEGTYGECGRMWNGMQLNNRFIFIDQFHYVLKKGRVGDYYYYDERHLSRNYTYVWYETTTNEKGEEVSVKHSETRTQTVSRCPSRRAPVGEAHMEGYRILSDWGIDSLVACQEDKLLCTNKLGWVFWVRQDGSLIFTDVMVPEEAAFGTFQDGGQTYLVSSDEEGVQITQQRMMGLGAGTTKNRWLIPYDKLAHEYEEGDSEYDRAFGELAGESLNVGELYDGGHYYTSNMLLPATVSVNGELSSWLEDKGVSVLEATGGGCKGFLLTAIDKGILFFDVNAQKGIKVASGCWYRTWKQGDRFYSVGFRNGDASYDRMDMAFARVYEYDLSELYEEELKAAKEEILEAEQAESESAEAASQSLEGETETEETREDMMSQWEERTRTGTEAVDLRPIVSEGETFDQRTYESEEALRQSMAESSRAAKIDAIVNGTSPQESSGGE